MTWRFWWLTCILFHMIAIVGRIALHDYIGIIINIGWIILMFYWMRYDEKDVLSHEPLKGD